MNFIVDMNLSPSWIPLLEGRGWAAKHWSTVGHPTADDSSILRWAAANDHVVLTRDLDFGSLLALGGSRKPSLVQIRAREVSPFVIGEAVLVAISSAAEVLAGGGIVTIEPGRTRIRHLPIR